MIRYERLTRRARFGAVTLVVATTAILGGCGPKKDAGSADADADASEVAVKVNGDPITVNQINLVLQRQRGGPSDPADAAGRAALGHLIDEQIVAQKAIAAKLDQDPQVIAQIEASRREILVHRFVETAAEAAGKPTDDQVQKFYDGHAAVFARRRLFTLQHLDIQAPDDRRADVDTHVRSLKSASALTDWLKAQNLHYTVRQEQDASDQLPQPLLEKLSSMKDGESAVLPSAAGVTAVTLVSSAPAPKTLADARPAIEQYLTQMARREVIVNLQKTIRDGAKIEYQGRFAASAPAAGASAAARPASVPVIAAPAASGAPAPAPASQNTSAKK